MKYTGHITLESEISSLSPARTFAEEQGLTAGIDPGKLAGLIQAVDEAVTNIIVHGYQDAGGVIEIEAWRSEDRLRLVLRDRASLFDPTTVPAPNLDAPLHSRPPGGLGVYLMRELTDAMRYRVTEDGENELTLEVFT